MLDQGAQSGFQFFPQNIRLKWFLYFVQVRFDCAGSHKVWVAVLVCDIFTANFSQKIPFVTNPRAPFRLRTLAQNVKLTSGLTGFSRMRS